MKLAIGIRSVGNHRDTIITLVQARVSKFHLKCSVKLVLSRDSSRNAMTSAAGYERTKGSHLC